MFPPESLACIINDFRFLRGEVDYAKDPDILKAVNDQTKQWTEMMMKQRKEEWELLKGHASAQEEIFKKLFDGVCAKQMKELEANFAKFEKTF